MILLWWFWNCRRVDFFLRFFLVRWHQIIRMAGSLKKRCFLFVQFFSSQIGIRGGWGAKRKPYRCAMPSPCRWEDTNLVDRSVDLFDLGLFSLPLAVPETTGHLLLQRKNFLGRKLSTYKGWATLQRASIARGPILWYISYQLSCFDDVILMN